MFVGIWHDLSTGLDLSSSLPNMALFASVFSETLGRLLIFSTLPNTATIRAPVVSRFRFSRNQLSPHYLCPSINQTQTHCLCFVQKEQETPKESTGECCVLSNILWAQIILDSSSTVNGLTVRNLDSSGRCHCRQTGPGLLCHTLDHQCS